MDNTIIEEIEKQAVKYVADIPFSNDGYQIFFKDQIKQVFKEGAKWGIAEGRKEVTYMKASEYDEYLNVCRENEALKALRCCHNCKSRFAVHKKCNACRNLSEWEMME